jgi:hypothetical protein
VRILSAVAAIVILGAVHGPVAAQSGPIDAAAECAAVDDDARRLSCYDALFRAGAGGTAPAVAASPKPAAAAVPTAAAAVNATPAPSSAPAAVDPAVEFGLTGQQIERRKAPETRERPPESIQARVDQAEQDRYGLWRLTLDNGQVWVQTEAALGARFQSGTVVEIRRGTLGSYVLEMPGRPVIRVRRLQ